MKLLLRSSILGNSAYRDLSYSALTDSGVGQDLALFLGFELLDSIELSASVGLVHSPVRPTGDEAHNVVFRFYRCAGVVFPRTVGSHEVLRRCGHGFEEGQAGRHPKKQAPRSCRVKVTRVRLALHHTGVISSFLGILAISWDGRFTISSGYTKNIFKTRMLARASHPFPLGEGRCDHCPCWRWTQTTRQSSRHFEMVESYPKGCNWDVCYGKEGEKSPSRSNAYCGLNHRITASQMVLCYRKPLNMHSSYLPAGLSASRWVMMVCVPLLFARTHSGNK